jgi:putative Mn2+ efflux pump MntP
LDCVCFTWIYWQKNDSLSKDSEEKKSNEYSFCFTKMFVLAFATSIDALAIGIIFALFKINIFMAVIITGITTFSISILGVKIGNKFGEKFKSRAKFTGGTVLVILGIKILIKRLLYPFLSVAAQKQLE